MKVLKKLTGGVKDAGGILLGKAAARAIPVQFGLPKQGAIGLGVQAGVGLAAAMLADKFLGREMGRMVLAGALSAPMETLVVSAGIPFLSPALSPVSQMGDLGAYAGTPLGVYAGAGRRALAGYSETLPPAPLPLSEDEEEWEPLY